MVIYNWLVMIYDSMAVICLLKGNKSLKKKKKSFSEEEVHCVSYHFNYVVI